MHIFIAGYYGFGNTGDEVILRTMVTQLRELRTDARITVTSATPVETAAAYGIESVSWCNLVALDEAIERSDLVLVGGGGLFFDTFGFDPAAFLTDFHTGIAFYTAPVVLGAIHRKPVMLYAVGVGPLVSEPGRRLTRLACDLASAITVRDAGSKTILASLGVAPEKVEVTADPAFGCVPHIAAASSPPTRRRPRVAVAVRPWDAGVPADAWEGEVVTALDALLARTGGSVVFVPFQHLPGRPEDDVVVAERFRARMKHTDRAEILGGALDAPAAYLALADSDLIVGVRLHSLVLGLLARVPVVALNYDPKVGQLMNRVGLGTHLLELGTLRSTALLNVMENALTSKAATLRRLDDEVAQLTRLARHDAMKAVALVGHVTRATDGWNGDAMAMIPDPWRAKLREAVGGCALDL